jgi:hypothetical protein
MNLAYKPIQPTQPVHNTTTPILLSWSFAVTRITPLFSRYTQIMGRGLVLFRILSGRDDAMALEKEKEKLHR